MRESYSESDLVYKTGQQDFPKRNPADRAEAMDVIGFGRRLLEELLLQLRADERDTFDLARTGLIHAVPKVSG